MAEDSPGAAATQVRLAVRGALAGCPRQSLVAVAVSGGRDSLALLLATVAVAPALRLRVGAFTVDHGWHEGSAAVAAAVAAVAVDAGADPVEVLRVGRGEGSGSPEASGGPEAHARRLRYAALDAAADRWSVHTVLLGHTLDDQAETVVMGLARGSGARSLAGMAARRGAYIRPMLTLRRAVAHDALDELADTVLAAGLPDGLPWEDPSNSDTRLLRARVRADLMPAVGEVLGASAVAALARSADLLRADADALDSWAGNVADQVTAPQSGGVGAALADLDRLPEAVRSRVVRLLAERGGAAALTAAHTRSLVALAAGASGSGAGPVSLPGGASARRSHGRLLVGPATTSAPGDDEER